MTIQEITLATQVATLVFLGWSSWNVSKAVRLTRLTTKAFIDYRSELSCLALRIELLEAERETRISP
jgi:hypothetical protein